MWALARETQKCYEKHGIVFKTKTFFCYWRHNSNGFRGCRNCIELVFFQKSGLVFARYCVSASRGLRVRFRTRINPPKTYACPDVITLRRISLFFFFFFFHESPDFPLSRAGRSAYIELSSPSGKTLLRLHYLEVKICTQGPGIHPQNGNKDNITRESPWLVQTLSGNGSPKV